MALVLRLAEECCWSRNGELEGTQVWQRRWSAAGWSHWEISVMAVAYALGSNRHGSCFCVAMYFLSSTLSNGLISASKVRTQQDKVSDISNIVFDMEGEGLVQGKGVCACARACAYHKCVFAHVWECSCPCVCIHVEVREQHFMLFLRNHIPFFLRQCVLTSLRLASLTRLAG